MARPEWPPEVPNYELLRMVGRGAFGEVWLGRHRLTGFWRAIKLVPRDAAETGWAADKELQGLRRYLERIQPGELHHLSVLEVGETPQREALYCVMELADHAEAAEFPGPDRYVPRTLREVIHRRGRLSPGEVAQLGCDLVEALGKLHAQGLLHRDIKPGNVLFVGDRPKLGDLGLLTTELSARSFVGTEGYVPPEGPGSQRADLYALGKVLYSAATGFDRHEFPRLPGDFDEGPEAELFRELNGIWTRACHNQPARRYRNAAEMLQALRLALAGESPAAMDRWQQRWRRTRRLALFLVPALGLAVGVAVREARLAREKSFELYRGQLARAAADIDRGRLGRAREELALASLEAGEQLEWLLLRQQSLGDQLSTHDGTGTAVVDIRFSPDGRSLVAQHDNSKATICLLSPEGSLTRQAVIEDIAYLGGFLGNDRIAGIAGGAGTTNRPLKVWQASTGRPAEQPAGANQPGKFKVAGTVPATGTVIFRPNSEREAWWRWQPNMSKPELWLKAPAPGADSVFFAEAGLSADGSALVRTWERGYGDHFRQQLQFVFADGRRAVQELPGTVSAMALSTDGRFAAYAEPTLGQLTLGRLTERWTTVATHLLPETRSLAFSPDSSMLASGGEDEALRLHRLPDLAVVAKFGGLDRATKALAWSPDGRWLVAGDDGGRLYAFSTDLTRLAAHRGVADGFLLAGGPVGLVADANETRVAATRSTTSIVLLDPETLTIRQELFGARTPLGFSPDGQRLWALTASGELVAVSLPTGAVTSHGPALGTSLVEAEFGALAPGRSRLLVFGGRSYAIWDVTGNAPHRIASATLSADHLPAIQRDPPDAFTDHTFSTDGRQALLFTRVDAAEISLEAPAATPAVVAIDTGNIDRPDIHSACHEPASGDWLLGADNRELLRWRRGWSSPQRVDVNFTGNYCLQSVPGENRLVAAGGNGRIVIARASDLQQMAWLQHRGLQAEGGEHTIRRLLPLSRSGTFLTLTESGRLVRW